MERLRLEVFVFQQLHADRIAKYSLANITPFSELGKQVSFDVINVRLFTVRVVHLEEYKYQYETEILHYTI